MLLAVLAVWRLSSSALPICAISPSATHPPLIVAIGLTLVLLTGHVDISVGSQFAIASVAYALLARSGTPDAAVLAVTGARCRAGSHQRVVRRAARYAVCRRHAGDDGGVARCGAVGTPRAHGCRDLPAGFQWFGLPQSMGETVIVGLAIVLAAAAAYVLRAVAVGRAVRGRVGPEAARLSGLRPPLVVMGGFVILGALHRGRSRRERRPLLSGSSQRRDRPRDEGACGGRRRRNAHHRGPRHGPGTMAGIALLGTLGTALTFVGLSPFWEKAAQGAMILVAAAVDSARARPGAAVGEPRMSTPSARALPSRVPLSHEVILAGIIVLLAAVFAIAGSNFATAANMADMVRLAGEVGLLAIALTPIVVTGGIDLSVGSLMGLVAVAVGLLWRDVGLSIWSAAVIGVLLGIAGGALNALLVARFSLPPLIVTLATLSLFRGLAEGITHGADFVSGFPAGFLAFGQGTVAGLPAQVLLLQCGRRRLWSAAAQKHRRTRGVRHRLVAGRCTLRGRPSRAPPGAHVRRVRCGGSIGRGSLRGENGPGQGGRGHGLRTARGRSGSAGGHIHHGWTRVHRRHTARRRRYCGAADRPAAGGPPVRACRHPDRWAAARQHRRRGA